MDSTLLKFRSFVNVVADVLMKDEHYESSGLLVKAVHALFAISDGRFDVAQSDIDFINEHYIK